MRNGHVVITGAAGGIGRALAEQFAKAGAPLTLVDHPAAAERAPEIVGARWVFVDLSVDDPALPWLAEAVRAHGPVDVLVNNAGVQAIGSFTDVGVDAHLRALGVNYVTPVRLIGAVLPAMRAKGRGHIINVCSILATVVTPFMHSYCSSKAALATTSECLGREERRHGVRVLTVYPGSVATDMGLRSKATYALPGRQLTPECSAAEMAAKIFHAYERGRARLVYPHFYKLLFWLSHFMSVLSVASAPEPRNLPGGRSP